MAYTIIATLKIKPGKLEEAKRILKKFALWVRDNEADTTYYLAHKVKGENSLLVYEKYKDTAAFDVHNNNFNKKAKGLSDLVEGLHHGAGVVNFIGRVLESRGQKNVDE